MGEDHRWMYDSWKKNGAHTDEWWERLMISSSVHFFGNYSEDQVSMRQMSKHEVCQEGQIDKTPHEEWLCYKL
jgi:hypothetical protein